MCLHALPEPQPLRMYEKLICVVLAVIFLPLMAWNNVKDWRARIFHS